MAKWWVGTSVAQYTISSDGCATKAAKRETRWGRRCDSSGQKKNPWGIKASDVAGDGDGDGDWDKNRDGDRRRQGRGGGGDDEGMAMATGMPDDDNGVAYHSKKLEVWRVL